MCDRDGNLYFSWLNLYFLATTETTIVIKRVSEQGGRAV